MLHSWAPHDAEQPWGEDPGGVDALVADLRARGAEVEHRSSDLADPEAPARLVDAALARFGRLDAVVAVHARSSAQGLEELTAAEFDLSWAVNACAPLLLVQAFAAAHDGAAGGRAVLFATGQDSGAMPSELPYVASKAAVQHLVPSLAVHLAPRGITVNAVDPGPTDTGWPDPATLAAIAARHPAGRWSTPADAAWLVAWLLSDEADRVTGQVLRSDGGWSAR